MKFFPLIWAAIWRKPLRTTLTLLSVTIAFLLFGMTIGLNARARNLLEDSRQDRIYVNARFGGALRVAELEQIKAMPGVKKIGARMGVFGYFRDPKNTAFVIAITEGMQDVWTELTLTPEQFKQLQATRNGIFMSRNMASRLNVKAGDPFPVTAAGPPRADGAKAWPFTILGIVDDMAQDVNGTGYAVGNYTYFDESRVANLRGNVGMIQLLASDMEQAPQLAMAIDRKFRNSTVPTQSITERDAFEAGVQNGVDIIGVTQSVAAAGLFMILFLTGNSIAQSVRERIPEFAAMKTIGFSDTGVMGLVFAEAVVPCLLGAGLGIGGAAFFTAMLPKMLPAESVPPLPTFTPGVLILAFAIAAAVAFASAVIPALRIKRLSVAAALSGR